MAMIFDRHTCPRCGLPLPWFWGRVATFALVIWLTVVLGAIAVAVAWTVAVLT